MNVKSLHFLIIIHFINISALEIIYFYCIHMAEMLYDDGFCTSLPNSAISNVGLVA